MRPEGEEGITEERVGDKQDSIPYLMVLVKMT